MGFSQSQSEAICHVNGPMMVLAGPGSGKTLVITHRTRYLIEQCGIHPSEILVITFTKAAAAEMKERFYKLMEQERLPVSFGTFHAVFFTVLRHAYGFTAENIIREEQRLEFLRDSIRRLELEIEDETEFVAGLTNEISLIKNNRISLEHYYSVNCPEESFRTIFREYEEKLRKARLLDFDDMLVYCYELFSQRADILQAWQRKYRYILIDEFQDINKIQYDIVRMLAKPENNLFIVGDDDQSIYRFRGAKPEIMLNFDQDYPGARRVLLDQNYRSAGHIVEAAQRVIRHNKSRFSKAIRTENEPGIPVEIRSFKKQEEENQAIIDKLLELKNRGGNFSDSAVLYRTNTQPRLLVGKLMEYNIPFSMRDMLPNIYDHWIARNLFSYMRIARGSRERREFLQIINRPKRYISRACIDSMEISFENLRDFYQDKEWMKERIDKMEYDIKLLSKMPPYAAVQYICQGIGYEEYIKEYAQFRKINKEELLDTIQEIQESAKPFQTCEEWFKYIGEYTEELKKQGKNKTRDGDSVALVTMHSAKGLEFDQVFILDANEGITPYRKAVTEADLEEERRMFYVALTRARKELYVYSAEEHLGKAGTVSRFVGEMLVDSEGLKPPAEIIHKKYGEGIIKAVDNGKLIIYFKKTERVLVLDEKFCIANQLIQIK